MTTDQTAVISKRDFAVAGVSLVFSGVGGAIFQKWLSKSKPSLEIVSFGFDGTPDPIKLSDDLKQKSDSDSWGRSLDQTSTFEALRSRYRSNLELIRRHETVIPQVAKWLELNKPRLAGSTASSPVQLTSAEIDAHSYMQDELMGSSMIGNIRRLQVAEPPITDFSKLDYKLSVLDRNDKAITVQIGRKAIRFPLGNMNSEQKRRLMTLMAESFARGVLQNIIYYSEFFISAAREDLLKLKALEEPLVDVLRREARLTINVALRNSGDTAAVLRQYYSANLSSKQYSKTLLLAPIENIRKKSSGSDVLSKLSQLAEESDSVDPQPDLDDFSKILPSAKGGQFSGIAAGEVKQLTLQSIRALGDDGKQIVTLFQSDVIECEVFGFTADGGKITSIRVPFGKSAVEREQADVLKQSTR